MGELTFSLTSWDVLSLAWVSRFVCFTDTPCWFSNQFSRWLCRLLESFCCKKSPNQEIGLRRFSEYRTSEGSEWYQIDPRWLRGHSCFIQDQFGIIRNLQMSPIPKTSQEQFLGLDFSYNKPTLIVSYFTSLFYKIFNVQPQCTLELWIESFHIQGPR